MALNKRKRGKMKNKDAVALEKAAVMQKLSKAIAENNSEEFAAAFQEMCENIQDTVLAEAEVFNQQNDTAILAARGTRQLTKAEQKYYEKVIECMKSANPVQALSGMEEVMPKTTIDSVFEDLESEFPLLKMIDFQNTSGLIEMIINTNEKDLATWSTLTAEIVKELTSGFKKVNMALNKLSAFLAISKAMLDLGPIWLDRYIRIVLTQALANGLEEGIINGTGKDMPIGMNRQVGEGVVVTGGVYPLKDIITVTSLDAITYGELLSKLAATPNGDTRKIENVILIVNPVDYFKKIMPATTIRTPDGKYVNDVLPWPTTVVQSTNIAVGEAIVGLAKRYFMGIGTAKSGKIEHSDEYKFLEDERVYLVKLYGHGEAKDDNAFMRLNIANLEPLVQEVTIAGIVQTKEVV